MVKTKRRNKHNDRLLNGAERAILRQVRYLKKQERLLKRKQARAFKRLEREQYEWAAMGW